MTPFDRGDMRLGAGVALTLCLLAAARAATAADAAAPASGTDALQEIVVTAQHKEENAQSTPIAM
jgi:outer membrane receptor protein involved in Fe transport